MLLEQNGNFVEPSQQHIFCFPDTHFFFSIHHQSHFPHAWGNGTEDDEDDKHISSLLSCSFSFPMGDFSIITLTTFDQS